MTAAVDVATALAAGRKASQLYPSTHPAFIETRAALVSAVNDMTATGPMTLNVHHGRLYHGDLVLPEEAPGVTSIREAFEARRIESMTLQPGFNDADATGLVEVLDLRPSPTLDVEQELAAKGVLSVAVAFLADEDDEERKERDRLREQDRAMYSRIVSVLRTVSSEVASGGSADLERASGMVGNIMSRLVEDQYAVLALATTQGASDRSLFHSVNVMIYSLTLGSALGLPEEGLASLGLAALMHDIGKAAFHAEDPAQAKIMVLAHPQVGAQILSRLNDQEDPAPMLVAYEHHMAVDGSGYPERPADYITHPYSRMVAIADRYANLVGPAEELEALTPDRAIIELLREAGRVLDPLFVRLFTRAMGVFPVGCLVRLSDQSVGVVSRVGDDPLKPVVRVSFDEGGVEIEEAEDVDLAMAGLDVLEVVDPASLNVAVADHL